MFTITMEKLERPFTKNSKIIRKGITCKTLRECMIEVNQLRMHNDLSRYFPWSFVSAENSEEN